MYSHANNIGQRAGQVSSAGHAVGGYGVHGAAFGNVGASTAASHQQFANTASKAYGKAGSQLYNQANLMHKTGQQIANTDANAASKFTAIGKHGTSSYKGPGGGYGGQKYSGGYQPKPKPKPPKPKPPKPKPPKPPKAKPNPFAKKAWYDNRNYLSSWDAQDEFKAKYPNYQQHRYHINHNVRPYHPEYNHITTADLVGVRGYTTNDYYDTVNKALRNGDMATVKKYESNIKTATSGLNELPPYYGPTVRKITIPPKDLNGVLDRYTPGRQVQENTFVSTTAGHTNNFTGNVVMHINAKQGGGHPIQNLSKYPTEGEVLFGPGSRFNVYDRYYSKTDNAWHIKMDEAK